MLKIKEYIKVESLEQAYELNQKKSNRIIGGMLWLRIGDRQIQTAIDLSGLGLDQIEETEEEFSIGAMVTLRQLEQHESLNQWTDGAVRESVRSIVGVQFRNLATVGGSIFGRFGFSDVLTMFLALDTYVELYKGGIVSLEEFVSMKRDNDVLVRLIVKKTPTSCVYLSHRNTKTDFPVMTCAIGLTEEGGKVSIGARPAKAVTVEVAKEWSEKLTKEICEESELQAYAEEAVSKVTMGNNMRASAAYRKHLAKVLLRRGLMKLNEEKEGEQA